MDVKEEPVPLYDLSSYLKISGSLLLDDFEENDVFHPPHLAEQHHHHQAQLQPPPPPPYFAHEQISVINAQGMHSGIPQDSQGPSSAFATSTKDLSVFAFPPDASPSNVPYSNGNQRSISLSTEGLLASTRYFVSKSDVSNIASNANGNLTQSFAPPPHMVNPLIGTSVVKEEPGTISNPATPSLHTSAIGAEQIGLFTVDSVSSSSPSPSSAEDTRRRNHELWIQSLTEQVKREAANNPPDNHDASIIDGGYAQAAVSPADSSGGVTGVPGQGPGGQKAFIPCKVCGDKASGYHYGVTSCEGCKGFFRRSIQKQIEYRCLRDGKCMVFRLNRNRCQYCRFKKCLAVGMSRDSVRYGRVPKRSRQMADDTRVSSMTGDTEADSELEKKQLALYDIILSVSQAHHSNCAYTDDKIKNLSHHPLHFPMERCQVSSEEALGSTDLLEQQKVVMWETMAQFTTPAIQRVVEFAKRIPGFTELVQDDQLILIKTGFFEVWLVRIARMFNPQQFTVTFSDGSYVTRDQLDLIYNPELVTSMFNFSVSFNNLHLNDGEVGLFTAVVLLTQDRPGLSDSKTVEQLQEKLIEALKLQLSRSHSSDPQVFPNLLMKLSELRSVGAKHNEVLGWYRMNWRLLTLPPLYAEIYDIPKLEEQQSQAQAPPQAQQQSAQQQQQQQQQALPQQQIANGSSPHQQGPQTPTMNGHHSLSGDPSTPGTPVQPPTGLLPDSQALTVGIPGMQNGGMQAAINGFDFGAHSMGLHVVTP